MKNKNGFTLVELIATIAILLLIVGIAIPSTINMMNKKKEQNYEKVIQSIKDAAETYVQMNDIDTATTTTILLYKLISEELLDSPVINPLTEEEFKNTCKIDTTTYELSECE